MFSPQGPSADTLRALETAPNMYLILSPDLYILTASKLYLKATSATREMIAGKHIFEAFPDNPEWAGANGVANIKASLEEVLRTKQPHIMPIQKYDVPDYKNPGKFIERYWDPCHTPILDESGDIQYIIQLATNVTEKVLAQKAQKESEERFRTMAEGSGILIAVTDEDGRATYFNRQWAAFTGRSVEELTKNGWVDLIHPEDKDSFLNSFSENIIKQSAFVVELRLRHQQNEYCWLLLKATPRFYTDQSFGGYIVSCIDISQQKKNEQRKNDFISMVSHELKTPLTSMKGYMQMLQVNAKKLNDSFAIPILGKANNQVKKMTGLINGFLNVSRLESGQIPLNRQLFDLADLMKEAEEETTSTIASHLIVFRPVMTTYVNADRDKIGQVVQNLINNAVKYSPAGTIIHVACVTVNGQARVSVQDQGMGLAKQDQSRVFDRYYRVETPATQAIGGFGIGLYLSKEIIERHGGQIGVESTLGQGSTFWFTLNL